MQNVSATEFKTKCLALLDDVAETGEAVTIRKRGRAVAQLVPVVAREQGYPQTSLKGTVEILGDISGPVLSPEAWEAENGRM